jgi:hypothetical protein
VAFSTHDTAPVEWRRGGHALVHVSTRPCERSEGACAHVAGLRRRKHARPESGRRAGGMHISLSRHEHMPLVQVRSSLQLVHLMAQVLIEWGTARHDVPALLSACSGRSTSRVMGYAQPDVLSCVQRSKAGRRTCGAPPHLHASHTAPAAWSSRTEAMPGAAYTGAASEMAGGRGTSMQRQRHSRSWTPSGRAWDSAEASRPAARPATQRRCAMLCGVVLVLVTGRCRG